MFIMEDYSDSMVDTLNGINHINILKCGEVKQINKNQKEYNLIIKNLEKLYQSSYLMPAFGVSLHDETIKFIQSGDWLEIVYNEEQTKNDLPYSSLLIKLESGYGTNIIRKYNGKYEGRCLYLSFFKEEDLRMLIP